MRRACIIAIAITLTVAPPALSDSSYPEPPVARQTFAITDQIIAQAKTSSNPLSNFLTQNEGRHALPYGYDHRSRRLEREVARSGGFSSRKIFHLVEQDRRQVLGR